MKVTLQVLNFTKWHLYKKKIDIFSTFVINHHQQMKFYNLHNFISSPSRKECPKVMKMDTGFKSRERLLVSEKKYPEPSNKSHRQYGKVEAAVNSTVVK